MNFVFVIYDIVMNVLENILNDIDGLLRRQVSFIIITCFDSKLRELL